MVSPVAIKTLLNQYRVEEFIGLTPLGELYRVIDERRDRSLALTLLPETITGNSEALKELEAASSRLQALSHPNLNKYLGVFQSPGHAFLLEEWVDGPSLKTIRERAHFTAEESLFIANALCSGLETLHKQNFLHLHLAPELIRVNQRGEIILCGIGAARPIGTQSKFAAGKYPPLYVPPEQLQSQIPGPAADMYALAVILYELTTGAWLNGKQPPKTVDSIRRTHLEVTPPAPSSLNRGIPDHFSRMILWTLRKNPEDRLKSTTELISSLSLALHTSTEKIPPRADPATAPVTSAALNEWSFLPPPNPKSIINDAVPLDERLATISTPKKRRSFQAGLVPIFLFVLVAGFISLFLFVRPAETPLPTPIVFTPIPINFTPPPTDTPLPRPTLTNGGRIIFTCTRGDYNQLCMVNRDGTDLVQLTDMAASNYYPVFTLDGSSILFASNRNGPFDLFLLSFGEKQVLQVTERVGNVISPDYSPDGRFILFANRVGDGPTAVWMVNADGLNPRLVYTGSGDIVSVTWSPDGERIAYAMNMGVPQEYEIFTMDTNGRNHLRISQGLQGIGGSVDWSPDGKSLLVHAGPFGDKDIFQIEAATGAFVQLTKGGNNAGASYSPDGRFIVFNSLRNNDQADLYIMNVDGSNQAQLTNHPEPDWGARWVE
ncbi:MAG: serine/threonine-protein kinase [Anaerolineales bacterium]|nr:serine/threonine-protein kinase [Anaerolineales bacterium]